MGKVLFKGNEALAEAALAAGCRFYSGYPITPQTEILEYLSWRMEDVGGVFMVNRISGCLETGLAISLSLIFTVQLAVPPRISEP